MVSNSIIMYPNRFPLCRLDTMVTDKNFEIFIVFYGTGSSLDSPMNVICSMDAMAKFKSPEIVVPKKPIVVKLNQQELSFLERILRTCSYDINISRFQPVILIKLGTHLKQQRNQWLINILKLGRLTITNAAQCAITNKRCFEKIKI